MVEIEVKLASFDINDMLNVLASIGNRRTQGMLGEAIKAPLFVLLARVAKECMPSHPTRGPRAARPVRGTGTKFKAYSTDKNCSKFTAIS